MENNCNIFGGGPGGPIETIPPVEACDLVSSAADKLYHYTAV